MNLHHLVVSCLAVAYLSVNVYAIKKVRVFESVCSRRRLLLYLVPFILGGSVICRDGGSWRSCADSMNGPPNGLLR